MSPQEAKELKIGQKVVWMSGIIGSVTGKPEGGLTVKWEDGIETTYYFAGPTSGLLHLEKAINGRL